MTIKKTMNDSDLKYCWDILPKVSRSFALCIPELPRITRDIVCVSYNICRIVDAIEDSKEKDVNIKREQINLFRDILLEGRVTDLEGFIEPVAQKAPNEYEGDLIENIDKIIRPFSSFPDDIKNSVRKWILEMSDGMKKYLDKKVETFNDQNEYCFFVAGTVGNMLTEIYLHRKHINPDEYMKMLNLAPNFGLGLQKTNIIKNVKEDFEEGRRYWPLILFDYMRINYEDLFDPKKLHPSLEIANKLIGDAQQHLDKGLEYTLIIPKNQTELRTFCLIPLLMAVATLSKCHNNSDILFSKDDVKISRYQVRKILEKSSEYCQDNLKIKKYYDSLKKF